MWSMTPYGYDVGKMLIKCDQHLEHCKMCYGLGIERNTHEEDMASRGTTHTHSSMNVAHMM